MNQTDEIAVSVDDSYVATVEIRRPPDNYFDVELITALADVFARLDEDDACRAIVLCSEGRHFCAGANLGGAGEAQQFQPGQGGDLYREAVRIFRGRLPVVAAVRERPSAGDWASPVPPTFGWPRPGAGSPPTSRCSASITGSA